MQNGALYRRSGGMIPGPIGFATKEMNDLFDRLFQPSGESSAGRGPLAATSVWEQDDQYHVQTDLPGVLQEDLEVTLDDSVLVIQATRREAEGDRKYIHRENVTGQVKRSITLPDSVDPESISAKFSGGVLHITLAKRAEVLPRKITVTTE